MSTSTSTAAARLARTVVLVDDMDAAASFYCDVLGFAVLFDREVLPGFRSLHVGPDGVGGAGLWLFPVAGPAERTLVGAQTAGRPLLVLHTDDLDALLGRAAQHGVAPEQDPVQDEDGTRHAVVRDPAGNLLVLAQLPGPALPRG